MRWIYIEFVDDGANFLEVLRARIHEHRVRLLIANDRHFALKQFRCAGEFFRRKRFENLALIFTHKLIHDARNFRRGRVLEFVDKRVARIRFLRVEFIHHLLDKVEIRWRA